MYAITGAMGQTGSAVASALLAAGASIHLIVRNDDARAAHWRARCAEIVVADLTDDVFRGQGFPEITVRAFCEMFHGFNDGTVVFESTHETRHGTTGLEQASKAGLPRTAA